MTKKLALRLAQKKELRALERIAHALATIPQIETVVFFGSRARGDFDGSSDMDMLIVITDIRARASRSLLILRGIDPETHGGIKTMLSGEFIRTGLLTKKFGETFRSIQSRRIESDYGDYVEIGSDEAADSLRRAQHFVKKAEEIANSIIVRGLT